MRLFFQSHGVLHYTVGLTQSLAKSGIDIDLILYEPLRIPRVNVHFIPRLQVAPLRWITSKYEKKILIPKLLKKADIVHTNVAGNADYALETKKQQGIPVVHTAHGVPMPEIEIEKNQISSAKKEAEMLVMFNDYGIPIVSISNFCQRILMKRLGIDSRVIYHGVDFKIYNPYNAYAKRIKIQNRFKLKNQKIVLSVMRLHPYKSPYTLIEAIPWVIKDLSDVKFILIGRGPLLGKVVALSKRIGVFDSIVFIERVSLSNLLGFYGFCDLFVHTSHLEMFGMAVLEAMACRKPVIVPDAGAAHEIIRKAGLTFQHRNPHDLADKILLLLLNDNLRENMAAKAFERSKEFRWDEAAIKYMQLYRSVL